MHNIYNALLSIVCFFARHRFLSFVLSLLQVAVALCNVMHSLVDGIQGLVLT